MCNNVPEHFFIYRSIGTTTAILIYKVLPYLVIILIRCSTSTLVVTGLNLTIESGPVLWVLNLSYLHAYILYICCTGFAYGWE